MSKLGLRHENDNFTNKGSSETASFYAILGSSVWKCETVSILNERGWLCGRWLIEKPLTLAYSDILFAFWKMQLFLENLISSAILTTNRSRDRFPAGPNFFPNYFQLFSYYLTTYWPLRSSEDGGTFLSRAKRCWRRNLMWILEVECMNCEISVLQHPHRPNMRSSGRLQKKQKLKKNSWPAENRTGGLVNWSKTLTQLRYLGIHT